jgi:hypothetical protein
MANRQDFQDRADGQLFKRTPSECRAGFQLPTEGVESVGP